MCLDHIFQRRHAKRAQRAALKEEASTQIVTVKMEPQESLAASTASHQSYRTNASMGDEQSILEVLSRRYSLDLDAWDDVKQLVSIQDFAGAMKPARKVLDNPDTDLWTDVYCRVLIALFTEDEGEIQFLARDIAHIHKREKNKLHFEGSWELHGTTSVLRKVPVTTAIFAWVDDATWVLESVNQIRQAAQDEENEEQVEELTYEEKAAQFGYMFYGKSAVPPVDWDAE